jgi:bilirubin oxidase
MATRRRFLKLATGGVGICLTSKWGFWPRVLAQIPGGTLPPEVISKFVAPLLIPPAMPLAGSSPTTDYYAIAVRQFAQQILPAPHRRTTVWGYGSLTDARTFNYPSYTIEAKVERYVEVTWVNQLVDRNGRYLPHLLPVDQTLHWANPPGGLAARDMHGSDPEPYQGPVPIVTHLHGGHSTDESDGYPEAWYLPAANNIPAGFAPTGTWYNYFRAKYAAVRGGTWAPGTAKFMYANDQSPATLWYHDHTLGMTG